VSKSVFFTTRHWEPVMRVSALQIRMLENRSYFYGNVRLFWLTAVLLLLAVVPGCGGKAAVEVQASQSEGGTSHRTMRPISGGPVGAAPSSAVYDEVPNDVRVVVVVDQAEIRDDVGIAEKLGTGIVLTPRRNENGKLRVRHSRRVGWIAKNQTIPIAGAMAYFTQKIRENPQDAQFLVARGLVHHALGRNELAAIDFDDAIALNPKLVRAHHNRGLVSHSWTAEQHYKKAIEIDPEYAMSHVDMSIGYSGVDGDVKHLRRGLELDPDNFFAYFYLAKRCEVGKNHDEFIKAVEQMLRLDPEDPDALNQRAWFMATSPQAKYRNGDQAVTDATKACEGTGWGEPNFIDSLAAAYAEVGDFRAAVKWQTKAILPLADDDDRLDDFQRRLELYRAGGPYRE
jgi:tetratricopeptide (TPR) repeat protein